MISIFAFLLGLTSLLDIFLSCIFGFFFIYKSRKINAKLLFYAGIMIISLSFVLLGNSYDFLIILITDKNTEYNQYIFIWVLGFILTAPGTYFSVYVSSKLIFTKKIIIKIISTIIITLIIITYSILILFPLKSLYFEYPSEPGKDLIDGHLIVSSPFFIMLSLLICVGFILCGLGFAYKSIISYEILRKKYLLLSIAYLTYSIGGLLDRIPFITNILLFFYVLLLYLGLREEKAKPVKKVSEKEIKIADSLFRLEESEKKLRESEEKYRLITENASDLITIFNDKFEIEYVNDKIHNQLLGYSKDDLIGKQISEFMHPDDSGNISKMRIGLVYSGKGSAEIRIKRKDGTYLWLDVKANNFINENKEQKILVVSTDVSEYKRAQDIIKKENLRLKRIDELRKEFMARATHDIKSPLNSIILGMEMLFDMHQHKDFENFERYFNEISNQLFRVKELAVNLLDYTILEIDNFQFIKERINLKEIVLKCIEDEKLRAKERGIEILYSLPDDIHLHGNKLYISQIFKNLISNAINYTPKLNQGKIIIQTEKCSNKVKISVKDNGIGLKQENMAELFKWGSNIESNNKNIIKGTGIGLFITKKMVDVHGGKIWAESEGSGKGSNFQIEFPVSTISDQKERLN